MKDGQLYANRKRIIRIGAVGICFIIFLIYAIFRGNTNLYYDSIYYWGVGDSVFQNEKFDIYQFPEDYHGYFFPVLVAVVKQLSANINPPGFIGYWILISMLMAVTLGISIPYLFHFKIDTGTMVLRLLACVTLILVIWGDFLQYPLSDFPATAFLISGAALLRYSLEHERWRRYISGLASGACLYAAHNTRTILLYGAAVLFIGMYAVYWEKEGRKLILLAVSIILGFFLLGTPQMMINKQYTGQYSPWVPTESYGNYEFSLQEQQLLWGLTYSRYETYVGNPIDYPLAGVRYADTIGEELVAREGISIENFSYQTILSLFLKYPLDLCGIYARHLVNLLTPIYTKVYINELFDSKLLLIFLSIVMWLAASLHGIFINRNIKKDVIVIIAGFCLPAILQMFGAPELRFFLPVHLLLYCYLCFGIDWKELWGLVRQYPVRVLFPCVVIFFAWSTILSNTLQSCQYQLQLISDTPKTYSVENILYSADRIELSNLDQPVAVEVIPLEPGALQSNTLYQISFGLECRDEEPEVLYFDLYGTDYDSLAQDFTFTIKKGRHTYTAICNSGTIPEDAVIRLIYAAQSPYTITDVQFAAVKSDR